MFSSAALILATLISGSLLQPIQKKLRHLVNRHLYHFVIDPDEIKIIKPTTGQLSVLSNQSLGQYHLMDAIGHGGMGEVYSALQPSLNRAVAIKVLARHLQDAAEFRTRFEREARAVASLKHPNIVQVYDFDYANDTAFMVMEYIEGQSLSDLIKEKGALPMEMALKLIHEIAQALDFTHAHGFVHRDIKPSNIMLRETDKHSQPQAVLMDFGIARLLNANTRVTGTGLLGTLDYVAPEQITEAHEVDYHADIYALGVMSFQMLTGKLPFEIY
jgi:serine/threonine-protein kinase